MEALRSRLVPAKQTDYAFDVISPNGFTRLMIPESVEELLANIDERTGIERLHWLSVCSANLESYLQDSIRLYVANLGYAKAPRKLSPVGDALAKPVINSSTVPDMIDYVQDLLDVDLAADLTKWKRAYKLRCAAVHNGGFVTPKVLKDIPDIRIPLGKRITMTWDDLKRYLEAADCIATCVDKKVSSINSRCTEVEWLLAEMKQNGKLPPKQKVWTELGTQWSIIMNKAQKVRVLKTIYD
jgi:hypothetical protein